MRFKMSPGNWPALCICLNVLYHQSLGNYVIHSFRFTSMALGKSPIVMLQGMRSSYSVNFSLSHPGNFPLYLISNNFTCPGANFSGPAQILVASSDWATNADFCEHLWSCCWYVNIGSDDGLVPSGNKPSTEPMLTQIYVAIYGIARPWWSKDPHPLAPTCHSSFLIEECEPRGRQDTHACGRDGLGHLAVGEVGRVPVRAIVQLVGFVPVFNVFF